MIYAIGIDPGTSSSAPGAMALVGGGRFVEVHDWCPEAPIMLVDTLRQWLRDFNVVTAALERVWTRPGQSASSIGKLLDNHGWWRGVLDCHFSTWLHPVPQTWQKGVVPVKEKPGAKPSLPIAREMFPDAPLSLQKHHGRADAILIAHWAWGQVSYDGVVEIDPFAGVGL